jgi:protein-S-isoprenylcysteine O-methyltransferase Ste14
MSELLIRGLTVVLLMAFVLVWASNLIRVRGSGGIVYSKRENLLLAAFSRSLVVASVAGVVIYALEPRSLPWSHLPLPGWLRVVGFFVGGAGVALLHWVLTTLGRNFSMSLVVKKDHSLVVDGPYRWVRHPMYTALSTIFLGLFLLTASWLVGGTAALAYGAIMIVRTPQEERMLRDRFGAEYVTYARGTGRFLPKLSTTH